jgi:hypothetical protein
MSNLELLLIEVKESLEREIRAGFAGIAARMDSQAARLDRQEALLRECFEPLERRQ